MLREDPIPALKRQAAAALAPLLEGWNAYNVAASIGTDARRVMEIRRGKLDRFSLETLIRYLTRMRRIVELRITEDVRTHRRPKLPSEGNR